MTDKPTEASKKSRVEALFLELLGKSPEERRRFLKANKEDDDNDVVADALSLIDAHDSANEFLEDGLPETWISPKLPAQVGNFSIKRLLGEGGFGSVYLAEQNEPIQRLVALKVVRTMVATDELSKRFEVERQLLARMNHPSIAALHDAGNTSGGQPYFAMEYVDGLAIDRYCEDEELSIDERIRLLIQVCNAIEHAHRRGVMHRDIKPSNILVTQTEHGDRKEPLPKVIDFGIGKRFDEIESGVAKDLTQAGQFVGTIEYMSPEQATMHSLDIDTRSDVYSIGVLLYQLLTGRVPRTQPELLRNGIFRLGDTLSKISFPKPSQLNLELSNHDLDVIVSKALADDRDLRYATVDELRRDLQSYLAGEPIAARRGSSLYFAKLWLRRNRLLTASLIAIATVILLGTVGTSTGWWQASQTLDQLRKTLDARSIEAANLALTAADAETAQRWIDEAPLSADENHLPWEWKWTLARLPKDDREVLRSAGRPGISEVAGTRWCSLADGTLNRRDSDGVWRPVGVSNRVSTITLVGDGVLMACSNSGEIQTIPPVDEPSEPRYFGIGGVNDVRYCKATDEAWFCTGDFQLGCLSPNATKPRLLKKVQYRLVRLSVSQSGDFVAAVGAGRQLTMFDREGEAILDDATLKAIGPVDFAIWVGNNELAIVQDRTVRWFDVAKQTLLSTVEIESRVSDVAAASSGTLVIASLDRRLITLSKQGESQLIGRFSTQVTSIALGEKTDVIIAGTSDGRVVKLKIGDDGFVKDQINGRIHPLAERPAAIELDPNGDWVLVLHQDGRLEKIRTDNGQVVATIDAHQTSAWSMAISQEGSMVATVGEDLVARVFQVSSLDEVQSFEIGWGVRAVSFADDDQQLLTGPPRNTEGEGTAGLWSIKSGELSHLLRGHSNWIMAATSQNSLLLTSDEDGVVIMRNINGDRVSAPKILSEGLAVASVLTWMPMEGEPRVIAGHQDGLVTTWDVEQLQQLPSPSAQNSEIAGVTSDGERTIVVPRNSRSIHVYNALAGGSAITSMRLSNSPIRAARFSRTALLILEDTLDGPQLRWWTRESLSEVD